MNYKKKEGNIHSELVERKERSDKESVKKRQVDDTNNVLNRDKVVGNELQKRKRKQNEEIVSLDLYQLKKGAE